MEHQRAGILTPANVATSSRAVQAVAVDLALISPAAGVTIHAGGELGVLASAAARAAAGKLTVTARA